MPSQGVIDFLWVFFSIVVVVFGVPGIIIWLSERDRK